MLFVGTFEARKGLDTLDAALELLEDEIRIVLAGRPGWGADEALSRLYDREHVEIVLEPPDERLAELYRGAAALLYTSRLEGFGLPVAEAMATACPVICSDLPAIREWGTCRCTCLAGTPRALRAQSGASSQIRAPPRSVPRSSP